MNGTLVIAANNIGHPLDTPQRSLEALVTAELRVFEEDRGARAMLKQAKITEPYLKLNEHDSSQTLQAIEEELLKGKTVLVTSDQGCPSLADPAFLATKVAHRIGAKIRIIPGPSALTGAIAAAPFAMEQFFYAGFLPRSTKERNLELVRLKRLATPVVLLEAPYRLDKLLSACMKVYGARHPALLAKDIGNAGEEYLYASLAELANSSSIAKCNFVLILESLRCS